MKKFLIIIQLSIILGAFSNCSQKENSIRGAWQLVHQSFRTADTSGTVNLSELRYPQIKIYTENYYSFGFPKPDGGITAGGGKYEFIDNKLVEHVYYHSTSIAIGEKFSFDIEIKNDSLILQGQFRSTSLMEKYVRLE